jgi:hypothetical protein
MSGRDSSRTMSARPRSRLEYHIATPALAATARREQIYLERRFSDHMPLAIDCGFKLRRTAGCQRADRPRGGRPRRLSVRNTRQTAAAHDRRGARPAEV